MVAIILAILVILLFHYIGDFLLQTDQMAKKKSTDIRWLGAHTLAYTVALIPAVIILGFMLGKWEQAVAFVLINGFLHGNVDMITSQINAKLWEKGQIHNFFCMIGFDQLVHSATLLLLFGYLYVLH